MSNSNSESIHACASLKEEDIQALESVYPDYIVEKSENHLRLAIPVELGVPRDVLLLPSHSKSKPASYTQSTNSRESPATIKLRLAHLPPVLLDLFLPDGYPLFHPPTISALHIRQGWISNEGQLAQILLKQWNEGDSVLCIWVELIRSGDFLHSLRLIDDSGTIWYVVHL